MSFEQDENKKQEVDNKDAVIKPDPETENTTDPQEHMEGPISSLMQKTEKSFESEDSDKGAKKDTED